MQKILLTLFVLFSLLFSIKSKANIIIDAPELRCVTVNNNGTVGLTWQIPADPFGTFNSYHVYYSNNPLGPFAVIDSIFIYATSTYTHTTINVYNQPAYYYLKSRSGLGGTDYSDPSDTLAAIRLNANIFFGTQAQLNWNPLHVPNLPSSAPIYDIQNSLPLGSPFSLLTNTPYGTETYTHVRHLCGEQVAYYIELPDVLGCVSRSTIDTVLFKDITPPTYQLFDSVAVNPVTGLAHMGWQPNPSADTEGYYIIKPLGGGMFQIIDTVFGINNTYYQYALSSANSVSEKYAIAAFDSCRNYVNNQFDIHQTVYLTLKDDDCEKSIKLNWNKYSGFKQGATLYQIYESENAAPYVLLTSTNDTFYTRIGANDGSTYQYFIKAVDNNGLGTFTSMSNIEEIIPQFPNAPQFLYLYYATVADSFETKIVALVDTSADIKEYKLWRALKENGPYEVIQVLNAGSNTALSVMFSDTDVNTKYQSYFYKVSAVDVCGEEQIESNIGKTILLELYGDVSAEKISITWSEYEKWDASVKAYNIYRGVDSYVETTPIATVNASVHHFTDDISEYLKGQGRICYVVEAVENDASYGVFPSANSRSNMVCVLVAPIFYIPNAFVPGGDYNPIFKPSIIFSDYSKYNMIIYNRWGQKVFETNDIQQGWDGTFNGSVVEGGVYVYTLYLGTKNGIYHHRKGSVTVLR
jgi:gliding motility-associated-like protein